MRKKLFPAVGEDVHYVSYGTPGGEFHSTCRAAKITEVITDSDADQVGLCVFNPTGLFFNSPIRHDENFTAGTWHWPEGGDK